MSGPFCSGQHNALLHLSGVKKAAEKIRGGPGPSTLSTLSLKVANSKVLPAAVP